LSEQLLFDGAGELLGSIDKLLLYSPQEFATKAA
jgi:hypothetical protein